MTGLATLGDYVSQPNQLEILKDDGKKKTMQDYQKVKPVFLKKLYDKMQSFSAVADRMKVSDTTISSSIKVDECTGVMEEFAKSIWFLEYEPLENPQIVLLLKLKKSEAADVFSRLGDKYASKASILE